MSEQKMVIAGAVLVVIILIGCVTAHNIYKLSVISMCTVG